MSRVIAACGLILTLAGCAAGPQKSGAILQSGSADAPLYETAFADAATCEMFLSNFGASAQESSRCISRLSGLAFSYEVQLGAAGRAIVHAHTLAGCERSRINAMSKDNMKVLSKCVKSRGDAG